MYPKAESKYLSIPQDKDIQEHMKHWQTKKQFHFFELVEMKFCFLQEQQLGKGINKIITIFFCVVTLVCNLMCAYEEHIPGYFLHTGWTVQRVQSKLKEDCPRL